MKTLASTNHFCNFRWKVSPGRGHGMRIMSEDWFGREPYMSDLTFNNRIHFGSPHRLNNNFDQRCTIKSMET